ncbi:uncharacterized protein LOC118438886 [Folsomia candida]|uniref:Uncharacterized protein n=1 Tax=Folsomia candida TaxID=158441 RepID=A0A226DCQ0_FOLCA|nr:uncharacterized protein LOC118438886 [Folsomia candida]OXA42026.1 hypothetical protein Fcan01_23175 [Folsomia candida]
MNSRGPMSLPFFAIITALVSTFPGNFAAKMRTNIVEEINNHATCNGDSVVVPPEWLVEVGLATTKCLSITDDECHKLCVAMSYEGPVKNGRLDKKFLRKESRKLQLSKKNEKWREWMLKEVEKCADAMPDVHMPTDKTESCPEVKPFQDCVEDKFQIACKGKKPDTELFLNDDDD